MGNGALVSKPVEQLLGLAGFFTHTSHQLYDCVEKQKIGKDRANERSRDKIECHISLNSYSL
ncbi:hypothetical protein NQ318_008427 [Aromia moschata]|uniref:Uncharacterized protein n=1 Tax=Aromia moschata TaxID=1265417 RepID=A0AAV8YA05_9CUCU|nr:hypothetical protein NQ318_008427 [Aromia moschata]